MGRSGWGVDAAVERPILSARRDVVNGRDLYCRSRGACVKRQIADFLRRPHLAGSRPKVLLTAYLLGGLALVFLAAILYTGRAARQMDRQAAALTRVFSMFVGESVLRADRPGAYGLIQSALREIEFPIVVTDASHVPLVWHRVDVLPQDAARPDDLAGANLTPEAQARRARLDALVREFDAENPPYPIRVDDVLQAYVHYGSSSLSRQLRWVPLVLVLSVAVFTAVALLVFRYMKLGEQRSIWVGMARETAHQLGTPLTSLLGWVQLLQAQDAPAGPRAQTYEEMQRDLDRLAKVSARFSKIGSRPELAPLDLAAVLHDTVAYIDRRIPHLGGAVRVDSRIDPLPPVLANRELLEWAFENLLKNAVDALEQGGEIRVRARAVDGAVEVRIADTGKGIAAPLRGRVFQPGYTTKRRGWGLGLALVLRIVEEYHDGRIWIEDNPDKRGICFALRLPAAGAATPPV
jgi:signal transduction histidine kinase